MTPNVKHPEDVPHPPLTKAAPSSTPTPVPASINEPVATPHDEASPPGGGDRPEHQPSKVARAGSADPDELEDEIEEAEDEDDIEPPHRGKPKRK